MDRSTFRLLGALAMSAGCAQDLKCYEGAVEINDVCECPEGTTYVRSVGACLDGGAPLSDAGGTDASVSSVEASERDGRVLTGDRDAATLDASMRDESPVEVELPPGSSCSESLLLCGDTCVDPKTDPQHCGGCAPCKGGSFCKEGACIDVGCSDGTREAFADLKKFPSIAGCAATWPVTSMRAERKLDRCGNSSVGCEAPVDACAAGWHVCGNTDGNATDITSRIAQADCDAQKGRFAAALGDQACTPCTDQGSGAVCCGDDCVQQQGSCVWPSATAWFGVRNGVLQLCGKLDNPTVSPAVGVMCCRDGK